MDIGASPNTAGGSDIKRGRLVELFIDLVQINSPSKSERVLADFLWEKLSYMGAKVLRDTSGEFIGGDSGNIIARFPGTGHLADAPPVMLLAHMDTVQPTAGIMPVISGGYIQTDGRTILGADDKAGIAVCLEAVAELIEETKSFRPIEVIFTIAEEIGLYGAKYVDLNLVEAKEAVVLDSGSPVGSVVTKSPAQEEFNVVFIGRAAHAGVEPEKGINAIQAAAEAITAMELGRLDDETTANIGIIHGGSAANIVPDRAEVRGEARSRDEGKLQRQIQSMHTSCVKAADRYGTKIEMKVERRFSALNIDDSHPLLDRLKNAAEESGIRFFPESRGGGSDANILNDRGITAVNMGLGLEGEHSTEERVLIENLVMATRMLKAFLQK